MAQIRQVPPIATSPDPKNDSERRRLPRLSLTSEQFRLKANGKIFSVMDLSSGGMAIRVLDREDLRIFPVGAVVEGTLNLRGEKLAALARVKHLRADLVGCEFEAESRELLSALEKLLDPATLGAELKPIPTQGSSVGSSIWYHGPSGTDLLLSRGVDGKYHRLTLFVLGSYVQWDEQAGLVTGRAHADDHAPEQRGIVLLETMVLEADSKPDAGKLSIAKTLILSSNLPQDLKKWCVRQLEALPS